MAGGTGWAAVLAALLALLLCCGAVDASIDAGPVRCTTCKTVVKQAERILQKPSTKANVTARLDQLCVAPPERVVAFCNATIHEGYEVLVNDTIALLQSPAVVGNVTESLAPLCRLVPAFFDHFCLEVIGRVWDGIVAELDKLLYAKEPEITARLAHVCTDPPPAFVNVCEELISRLYDWGVSIPPATVCERIGACK